MIGIVGLIIVGCNKEDDVNGGSNDGSTPTNPTDTTTTDPTDPTVIAPNPTQGEWIDLGLPSGLLWYSVNLGATMPEGYGDYYAWGETSPRSVFTWDTYSLGDYNSANDTYTMYKYNFLSNYGTVDNKTVLEAVDDVVTVVFGSGARIPTKAEWQELLDNTTAEWTMQSGVYGSRFTATNGNGLFLPAAGHWNDSELCYAGELGYYWSSSLLGATSARCMVIRSDHQYEAGTDRYRGLSVRAVCSQN